MKRLKYIIQTKLNNTCMADVPLLTALYNTWTATTSPCNVNRMEILMQPVQQK